jgi:transposase
MSRPILPDRVWALLEPLLPTYTPSPKGGRPRLSNRQALTGILFVLKTGTPWEDLPTELGCGTGMSCWRYLRDWQRDGTWQRVHAVLLHKLDKAGKIDWSRAAADAATVRAVFGGSIPDRTRRIGAKTARNTSSSPTDAAPR